MADCVRTIPTKTAVADGTPAPCTCTSLGTIASVDLNPPGHAQIGPNAAPGHFVG